MNKNKWIYLVLVVSVALNCLLLIRYVKNSVVLHNNQSKAYGKPAYYVDRDQYLASLPIDSNSIVFLGNSLTQYFELAEHFGNINIKNRGIGGDNLPGLLSRVSTVISGQPKKIFIEIGGNDIRSGVRTDVVFTYYKRLLDTLTVTCPSTEIYVQSIFPVGGGMPDAERINSSIGQLNSLLQRHCKAQNIRYVDVHGVFLKKGKAQADYFVADGVHLSAKGYQQWAALLKPFVER